MRIVVDYLLRAALAFAALGCSAANIELTVGDDTAVEDEAVRRQRRPMYVFMNSHGHNFVVNESDALEDRLATKARQYDRHHEEILWMASESESRGGRWSFQMNGEYARDAREFHDDVDTFRGLIESGHSIGVHFHKNELIEDEELWLSHSSATATLDVIERIWNTQIAEVEETAGQAVLRVDPGVPHETEPEWALHESLLAAHQIPIVPAGESFTYAEWNHFPMNPFRRQARSETLEDFSAPTVAVPTHSQTGLSVPQGLHRVSTTVPQLQRHFLQTMAMRKYEAVDGSERIWAMGAMTHPSSNNGYRDDVEAWLDWLVDAQAIFRTPRDRADVRWVTDEELVDVFERWEGEHPETSSFSFDTDAHLDGDEQPYPYALEPMIDALVHTELVEVLDLGDDVYVFELAKREIYESTTPRGQTEVVVGDLVGESMFLLWSKSGVQSVDFGAGAMFRMNGRTGEISSVRASAVRVGPTPIVVSRSAEYL